MVNMLKNKCSGLFLGVICTILSNPVFAQSATKNEGFNSVKLKTSIFVDNINQVLSPLGVGIATIAVFVFGYQVSFGGKSPAAAAPILVGGLIIGAAAAIAGMLVGKV